jgi:hypothetical protein
MCLLCDAGRCLFKIQSRDRHSIRCVKCSIEHVSHLRSLFQENLVAAQIVCARNPPKYLIVISKTFSSSSEHVEKFIEPIASTASLNSSRSPMIHMVSYTSQLVQTLQITPELLPSTSTKFAAQPPKASNDWPLIGVTSSCNQACAW